MLVSWKGTVFSNGHMLPFNRLLKKDKIDRMNLAGNDLATILPLRDRRDHVMVLRVWSC
jgi:hypothetical protein